MNHRHQNLKVFAIFTLLVFTLLVLLSRLLSIPGQVITDYTYAMMPSYPFQTTYEYGSVGTLQRGDLIVYVPTKDYLWEVARVIGLPSEHVELKNGSVLINGLTLNEPYISRASVDEDAFFEEGYFHEIFANRDFIKEYVDNEGNLVVGESFIEESFKIGFSDIEESVILKDNQYYIITDNRSSPYIQRGSITRSQIQGKITSTCKLIIPVYTYCPFNLICFRIAQVKY